MIKTRSFLLFKLLDKLPLVKDVEFGRNYSSFSSQKFIGKTKNIKQINDQGIKRINYACGGKYLQDWLNVDFHHKNSFIIPDNTIYYAVDLTSKHPFPDNHFEFGFAEDFIEHLQQVDSIIFLSECFRTFKTGGVLRLAFPGLEGVLQKHYPTSDYETIVVAKEEAYTAWGHLHFYSREELATVAKHIGFSEVNFMEYGVSNYPVLAGLETREEQIGLNTYVELVK
jgi:predicted SAM-dependent methyltransferase